MATNGTGGGAEGNSNGHGTDRGRNDGGGRQSTAGRDAGRGGHAPGRGSGGAGGGGKAGGVLGTLGKPIDRDTHGLIEWGHTLVMLAAPTLLRLKGPARKLCYLFGIGQLGLNAVSDHAYAVKRVVPMETHKAIETPILPAMLLLPMVTGAMSKTRAKGLFLGLFAVGLATYLLTDYSGGRGGRTQRGGPRPNRAARRARRGGARTPGRSAGLADEQGGPLLGGLDSHEDPSKSEVLGTDHPPLE